MSGAPPTRSVARMGGTALALALTLVGCLAPPLVAQPAGDTARELPPAPAAGVPPLNAAEVLQRTLRGINHERTLRDLPPLLPDPQLAAVAEAHSRDMATRGYFGHASPEGVRASSRVRAAGYRYRAIGENLFQGSRYGSIARIPRRDGSYRYDYDFHSMAELAELIVQGWMDSQGHRENMLSGGFSHAGLGLSVDERDRVLVTLLLSRPLRP